jgi:hypothetical protein
VTTGDRGLAVADRLEAAARSAGMPAEAVGRLRCALDASLGRRRAHFRDPRHADFLHTARTALILLHDTPLADADALSAAVLFDSEEPALSFARPEAATLAGDGAAALLVLLPTPAAAGDELLERLITAPSNAQLVTIAERLDHARHLHLRPTERWPGFHSEIEDVYLPVAERVDPTLARRFRWWADMFARRYL